MERKSFVFYRSFAEAIEGLDNETRLECFDAIVSYGIHGEEKELDGIAKMIFTLVKPQLDANNKKYLDGKKGGEYGKLGGRPKTRGVKDKNPTGVIDKNPNGVKNKTPNVNVNDNENVNVNDNDNNTSIDYNELVNLFNNTCTSLSKIQRLTDKRKKAIKTRLKTFTIDDYKKAFQMVEESDFLSGRSGGDWKASFDWLLNEANLTKVLEGNYKNNKTSRIEINPEFRRFQEEHELVHFNVN